jgi:hypothetical protein
MKDITAFWRPQLKHCPSKHYHPIDQRALPAIIIGMIGDVGHLGEQRLALSRCILRVRQHASDEESLQMDLHCHVTQTQRLLRSDLLDLIINIEI